MSRLFRDWRFAMVVVLGLAAMAATYAADAPGDPMSAAPVALPSQPQASPSAKPSAVSREPEVEREAAFGEPLVEPTGYDPNPPDPQANQPATAPTPAAAAGDAYPPAPNTP